MSDTLTEREARRLLGWGLRSVSVAGDVELAQDIVIEAGDLALVAGTDALRQDISAALVTALGSDPLNVTFGFDGFEAVASEPDRFLLRERLRVSVINLLRRDGRVAQVDQVLIGAAEIAAARSGAVRPPPATEFGLVEIEAAFRLRGQPGQVRLTIGSSLGSG